MPLVNTPIRRLLIPFFCFFLVSCAPEQKHRVLSFFFDGVPLRGQSGTVVDAESQASPTVMEGEQPAGEVDATSAASNPQTEVLHEPFKERACESCHTRSATSFLSEQGSGLCFQCHDDSPFKSDFLHGPVAAGACAFCHHPHRSLYASLLKKPVRDLCLDCHLESDVLKNPEHDAETSCVLCHNPHASDNQYLLE